MRTPINSLCSNLIPNWRSYLKQHDALAVFHYLSLHKSEYYLNHGGKEVDLPNCDKFADQLVRLPMYFDLKDEDVEFVINIIKSFYSVE